LRLVMMCEFFGALFITKVTLNIVVTFETSLCREMKIRKLTPNLMSLI
jgi:hypothetical protein